MSASSERLKGEEGRRATGDGRRDGGMIDRCPDAVENIRGRKEPFFRRGAAPARQRARLATEGSSAFPSLQLSPEAFIGVSFPRQAPLTLLNQRRGTHAGLVMKEGHAQQINTPIHIIIHADAAPPQRDGLL